MTYLLAFFVAVATANEYPVCSCPRFVSGARPGDVMCQKNNGIFCDKSDGFGGMGMDGCGYMGWKCILEAACPCAEGQYELGAKDGDMMCNYGDNCAPMPDNGVCFNGATFGKWCFLNVGKKETPAPEEEPEDEPFEGCDEECDQVNVAPCECIVNLVQWFNRQERIALDNKERVLKEMSSYPLAAVQGLAKGAKFWADTSDSGSFPWTKYQSFFSGNMWLNGQPNWKFTAKMAKDFSASLQYAVDEMKIENLQPGRFVSANGHVTGTGMIAGMAGFAGAGLVAAAVLYTYVGKRSTVEESMA